MQIEFIWLFVGLQTYLSEAIKQVIILETSCLEVLNAALLMEFVKNPLVSSAYHPATDHSCLRLHVQPNLHSFLTSAAVSFIAHTLHTAISHFAGGPTSLGQQSENLGSINPH